MEIKDKNFLVVGLGITGKAVGDFLVERGARVFCHDDGGRVDFTAVRGARQHSPETAYAAVVPSPGVPPGHPLLREATRCGVPIMSEVELAFAFARMPVVAITGTNGKTTTTSLIGEMLRAGGKEVFVGGNIGTPFIQCVGGRQDEDFAVLELSSFQLLHTRHFHAAVAVLLNITRDHTDYHGSLEAYAAAKGKIFANQVAGDTAIVNAADENSLAQAKKGRAATRYFHSAAQVPEGMFLDQGRMVGIAAGREVAWYETASLALRGRHNLENAMASILAAAACGVDEAAIRQALSRFRPAPHRLEIVTSRNGVEFYDDSKGTNVDATLRALEAFAAPVVLLLGGRDKDGNFERLIPRLRERVRLLLLFGEARETIAARLGGVTAMRSFPDLRTATQAACHEARSGEVVLLSPACASFDAFANYKERGHFFQQVVKEFAHE